MKKSSFINFSDYLGANAEDARAMESQLRANEMDALKAAQEQITSVGDAATNAAYWGDTPEDFSSYQGVAEAQKTIDTAKTIQNQMQTDVGQRALLSKQYGGATGIDALMTFGGNTENSEAGLASYLGLTAEGIGGKADELGKKYAENRDDYLKEKAAMDAANANTAEYDKESAAYDEAVKKERQAYLEEVRRNLLSGLAPGGPIPGSFGAGTQYADPGFTYYLATGQNPPGKNYEDMAVETYTGGGGAQQAANKLGIGTKPGGKSFDEWLGDRGVTKTTRRRDPYQGRLLNRQDPRKTVEVTANPWAKNTGGVKW